MKDLDETKYYVFYDGDCGFCNRWIQWILKNDRKDRFRFAALQSNFGQHFLWERELSRNEFNTLYLWKPNAFYLVKSEAVLEIARILGGRYGLLSRFNIFPTFIADKIYDSVAARRKNLGPNSCFVPTEEERKKFIE